ncbi:MAG: hypothetical protein IKO44_00325 [Ruminococcus sp.]|nr:hypothetical protein [Ruminococcus sp.]
MAVVTDINLNEKVSVLERRVKKLERLGDGGNAEMKLLKELVGKEVIINASSLFETKCRIEDIDEEWLKITEHGRKTETVKYLRIDDVVNVSVYNGHKEKDKDKDKDKD